MKAERVNNIYSVRWNLVGLLLVVPFFLVPTMVVHAFQFEKGALQGSLDTTLSYGAAWRLEKQDDELIGTANRGKAFSVNGDDGNINYDRGLISNVAKMTSELELLYQNFGVFVRGTGFYDFENERGGRERTDLTSEARELVGRDIDLLDAYLTANFRLGNMPLTIRAGEQVVSWGESTFIQNGINAINPINVNALRLPGSELREGLVPEGLVWASLGITDNITFECLYLYDWEETVIDPPGSYWSTNDFVGEGGEKVLLGFGDASDNGSAPPAATTLAVPRASDNKADNQGQFGLAFRIFAPQLNESEFGFYFLRYHSRLPIISAVTGSLSGYTAALIAAAGDPTNTSAIVDAYASTAFYRVEYPEYINLYGLSFNTSLGTSGVALQGEVSYRDDTPLQVDDIELLYSTLSVLDFIDFAIPFSANQVGNFAGMYETDIKGYILCDVTQVQATATKFFGPTFGTDQIVLLGEIGMTYVEDMPDKDDLRLDGAGTYTGGNPAVAGAHAGKRLERRRYFADQTSSGYVIVTRFDYNNVIQAVNLSPRLVWRHDFYGNTPRPAGNFLEGRKTVGVGLKATYQETWELDLSYTNYFGAGRHNLINDRDFIQVNLKYSF